MPAKNGRTSAPDLRSDGNQPQGRIRKAGSKGDGKAAAVRLARLRTPAFLPSSLLPPKCRRIAPCALGTLPGSPEPKRQHRMKTQSKLRPGDRRSICFRSASGAPRFDRSRRHRERQRNRRRRQTQPQPGRVCRSPRRRRRAVPRSGPRLRRRRRHGGPRGRRARQQDGRRQHPAHLLEAPERGPRRPPCVGPSSRPTRRSTPAASRTRNSTAWGRRAPPSSCVPRAPGSATSATAGPTASGPASSSSSASITACCGSLPAGSGAAPTS